MTTLDSTIRTVAGLVDVGLAGPADADGLAEVERRYAIAITPAIMSLIETGDANDPIARQFVPDDRELVEHSSERADPIGDHVHSPVKGLVHRYADRVLLKIVGVCPVYCRFCFRREMVGPKAEANLSADEIANALAYVRAHPEIWEVILTGGDPFILSPRRVEEITRAIADIPHVQTIRWHTRVPIAAPHLVSEAFVAALKSTAKAVYVAIHTNHPRELSGDACAAIARLADAGIPLLSQTVLLAGVNDSVETLDALMRALVKARIKPYYLHHADLAPGTSHFRTTIEHGQSLIAALRVRLSGMAMPTYVLDIPGGFGKVPIAPSYLAADQTTICDPNGMQHHYPAVPLVRAD